jgi:hypothetical protein
LNRTYFGAIRGCRRSFGRYLSFKRLLSILPFVILFGLLLITKVTKKTSLITNKISSIMGNLLSEEFVDKLWFDLATILTLKYFKSWTDTLTKVFPMRKTGKFSNCFLKANFILQNHFITFFCFLNREISILTVGCLYEDCSSVIYPEKLVPVLIEKLKSD